MTLRVGTRGSALARTQTRSIVEALARRWPDLDVETREIVTEGDRSQDTNLPSPTWGQGVFVKEIEWALLRGEIDLAVHSLKDVPPLLPPGVALTAIPEREDPSDVLVTLSGGAFDALPAGARIGTSSARRVAFLRAARPDLQFLPIRGNVDTRCRKLFTGDYDAIVLARAGLARLHTSVPFSFLDVHTLPPAPGQGALVVETRADDPRVQTLVRPLDHAPTAAAVAAERTVMAELGGGCRLPFAALATYAPDGALDLMAAVASPEGETVLRAHERGRSSDPEGLGRRVAAELRAQGAEALMGAPTVGVS